MTDPTAMEPFEARLGELVRAYPNPAAGRPCDGGAVSRAAMSTRGAAGWAAGMPGWRIAGAPWAAALAAAIVIAVVAITLLQRPTGPATEPQPSATATTTATFGLIPE